MPEVLTQIPSFMNLKAPILRTPRADRSKTGPASRLSPLQAAETTANEAIEVIKQPVLWEEIKLDDLWYQSWRSLGTNDDGQATFEFVLSAHNDPARRVHTIQHLLDCFTKLKRWHKETRYFHQVAMAIWFHDAIFDPQRHDNEARSARLANDRLSAARVAPETVQRIRELIISTRPGEQLQTAEARLLHDIDRAVLGSSNEAYDRYERNLRFENGHIGDFIYRRKRIEQLQALQTRTQLYLTDSAQSELQAPAVANLNRWLENWQQPDFAIPAEVEARSMPGHVV